MKKNTFLLWAIPFSLGAVFLAPFLGAEIISPLVLFGDSPFGELDRVIFWQIRFPRTVAAWIAGAGLALGGMTFQAMFRNSLATPFTLGVASGASLGAAVAVRLGLAAGFLGTSGVSLSAFVGALFSVILVYGISRSRRDLSTGSMLLAGVAVSFFFSSLILFIQYMSDFAGSHRILRWLMGGLEGADSTALWNMSPFVLVGSLVILLRYRELDLLGTGEELAASRGMDVEKTRKVLFLAASLLVGGIVAVCGPIGFVGLMVPHVCRLMVGASHRLLAPATLFCGALFLVFADILARTLAAPAELPVGILTALLGGPFFLWLLLRRS